MKILLSLTFVVFATMMADADVLLSCHISEDDISAVTIAETDGVYSLTEVSNRGESMTSEITYESVENEHYRLSDGRFGFRYLSMMYSDIFDEFNWFVESRGGFSYSISRAYCE